MKLSWAICRVNGWKQRAMYGLQKKMKPLLVHYPVVCSPNCCAYVITNFPSDTLSQKYNSTQRHLISLTHANFTYRNTPSFENAQF